MIVSISTGQGLMAEALKIPLRIGQGGTAREVMTYAARKGVMGAHMLHFLVIQQQLLEIIQKMVREKTDGSLIFLINPLKSLNELSNNYLGQIQAEDDKTKRKFAILQKTIHLDRKEWVDAALKVFSISEEFIPLKRGTGGGGVAMLTADALNNDIRKITGNFFTFPLNQKEEYLKRWEQEYIIETTAFFFEKMGIKSLGESSYSIGHLAFLGVKEEADLPPAKLLSCIQFALLKSRAPCAREVILNKAEYAKDKLLSWWESKGYRLVEEPQAGDLALYLNAGGDVIHVGLCAGKLSIISKPGDSHPYVYMHRVFDFLGFYQWNVVFIRNRLLPEKE